MKLKKSEILIILLFYFTPIIDAVNGFLVLNNLSTEGGFSIGQLYRLFLMSILASQLGYKKNYLICLSALLYLTSIEVVLLFIHNDAMGTILGLVYSYKILYLLMMFLVLKRMVNQYGVEFIIDKFINSALIYSSLLFFSLITGLQSSTYADGSFGTKGFFASGNGLSLFFGASSLIALYRYSVTRYKHHLLVSVLILLAGVLVGTKASIASLLLYIAMMFLISSKITKVITLTIMLPFFVFMGPIVIEAFSIIFDVIIYRFENSDSIFAFLASSRDRFFEHAISVYNLNSWLALRLIFGSGVFVSFRNPLEPMGPYDTLESDFLDVFFMYGVLGLFAYFIIISVALRNFATMKRYMLLVIYLVVVGYSLVAGHVLFNAMSSMLLVILSVISAKKSIRYD